MSETASKRPTIGPWTALAVFVLLWLAALEGGGFVRSLVAGGYAPQAPRDIVAFRMASSLPFTWIGLGGTVLLLRLRGQRAADIGWGKPAALWGWVAALVVIAFYFWGSFRTPSCRGLCFIDPHTWLTDWSVFRLVTSVAIGITAGICEETAFRGFVMTQARAGGAPLPVQILLSGVTFGLAHFGVAGLSGRYDVAAAIGIIVSTTVFGAIFAIVYVLGRRSLTPVILAHGLFAFVTEPWMLLWGLNQTMHAGH